MRYELNYPKDALEKFRLTALKDKSIWDGSDPLNVTIKAVKDEEGKGGRIIITGLLASRWTTANCSSSVQTPASECLRKS